MGPMRGDWRRSADVKLAESSGCSVLLRVIGSFDLIQEGRHIAPGASVRRVLAFLAIEDGPLSRALTAETLWPDVSRSRAQANLRSALWRLQQCCRNAVEARPGELRLTSAVMTDIRVARGVIERLLDRSRTLSPAELSLAIRASLHQDLLIDCYDEEWLLPERERFQQQRLHALEVLSEHLTGVGWHGAAIDTALSAVQADPFREAAHATLVRAHLAEGNYREAKRRIESFRTLMLNELGVEPSERFTTLLHPFPA